jgi:transposase
MARLGRRTAVVECRWVGGSCWVVERTFSWFGRNYRLAKDFENLAGTRQTLVILAAIQLAIRWPAKT